MLSIIASNLLEPTITSKTGFSILFTLFLVVVMFLMLRKPLKALNSRESKFILANGKPGKATILTVSHGNEGSKTTINSKPFIKVELEIHNQDNPYIVFVYAVISYELASELVEGSQIPVTIHPEDYMKVAVDWKALAVGGIKKPQPIDKLD